MTQSTGSPAPAAPDFAEIEAAVMETERGRWFLGEFARQNRAADTTMLLDAIAKLEKNLGTAGPADGETASFREAICDMAEEIEQAKREIAELAPGGVENEKMTNASAELDAIVESTETATSSILEAAEAVQELAWTLREEGVADACCDALDLHATEIYTACSFQDITGQRITKVVGILRMLDNRIGTMAKLWGGSSASGTDNEQSDTHPESHLLNGPALDGEAIDQDEVDRMMYGNVLDAGAEDTEIVDAQTPDDSATAAEDDEIDADGNDAADENAEADAEENTQTITEALVEMAAAPDTGDAQDQNDMSVASQIVEFETPAESEAGDLDDKEALQAGPDTEPEASNEADLSQKDFDALFA